MQTLLIWQLILAAFNTGLFLACEKLKIIRWLQFRVPEWVWPSRCFFCFVYRLAFIEMLCWLLYIDTDLWWLLLIISPLAMSVFSINLKGSNYDKG